MPSFYQRGLLWLLLCIPTATHAQVLPPAGAWSELGRPLIQNFSQRTTSGAPQCWSTTQNWQGVIFVANTQGILQFDGEYWTLLPNPTQAVIRSLDASVDGRNIYYGGYGTFGYLDTDTKGQTKMINLAEKLDASAPAFENIWETYATTDGALFVSDEVIFKLAKGQLSIIRSPEDIRISKMVGKQILVQLTNSGLFELKGDQLVQYSMPVGELPSTYGASSSVASSPNSVDFTRETLYLLERHPSGGLLIGTRSRGLEVAMGNKLYSLAGTANAYIQRHGLYAGRLLSNGLYALATNTGGVIVCDANGELLFAVNKEHGLQDNTVRHVFQDHEKNLWLALSSGVSRVEQPGPHSFFGENDGLVGEVKCIMRSNGRMYAGTSLGLFASKLIQSTTGERRNTFVAVKGLDTEVRALQKLGDALIAATSYGLYVVDGDASRRITDGNVKATGLAESYSNPKAIWVLLADGLGRLESKAGGGYSYEKTPSVSLSIGSLFEDVQGNLWAYTTDGSLHVVLAFNLDDAGIPQPNYKLLDQKDGLPEGHGCVSGFEGSPLFITTNGLLRYNGAKSKFLADETIARKLGRSFSPGKILQQDAKGAIWYLDAGTQKLYYTDPPDASGRVKNTYRHLLRLPAMQITSLFLEGDSIGWIGAEDGMYRFDRRLTVDAATDFQTHLVEVVVGSDSLLMSGYLQRSFIMSSIASADTMLWPLSVGAVPYNLNSARFRFSATTYHERSQLSYQYRLIGLDEDWSPWTLASEKEYSFLPPGSYTFQVRAKNVYDQLSAPVAYQFRVIAPWYRRWWAFVIYSLSLAGIVYGGIRLRSKQLDFRNQQLQAMVESRTHELAERSQELETSYEELTQKERLLSEALYNLEETQEQLIRNEKMAAMGKLITNIAHEINTPIGAIRGTTNHLQYVLRQLMGTYPELVSSLSAEERELFIDFVRKALLQNEPNFTTREEREKRAQLRTTLEGVGTLQSERVAILLTKAGFWELKPELMPLVQHPRATELIDLSIQLVLLKMGLDNIGGATEKTRRIVSTLKTFIPGQLEDTDHSPVVLKDCMQRVLTEFDQSFRQGIVLETQYDRTLRVKMAMEDLENLFRNLVHNSIQAMGVSGTLKIRMFEEPDLAVVTVADTGVGIPEVHQAQIFEPFFSTKRQGEGSGLGLYMVQRILEKTGGSISFTSTPGRTVFTVRLPLVA